MGTRKNLLAWAASLGLCFVLFSAVDDEQPRQQEAEPPERDVCDRELVRRIQAAIAKKTSVEEVEEVVGAEAWVNSFKNPALYHIISMLDDPEPGIPAVDWKKVKNAVYWQRLLDEDPAFSVVGIVWYDGDRMQMFYGTASPR
jgi:hypothetical protein